MSATPRIDNRAARRTFLHRHALAERPPSRQTRAGLLDMVTRLGFVQIDSINTVARAHDLILFTRNRGYRPSHLRWLVDRDRSLFEGWTHDASIIPTEFFPHWQIRFAREEARLRARWAKSHKPDFLSKLDEVVARIEAHGPAMSRHLSGDDQSSNAEDVANGDAGEAAGTNGGWWDWHPSKAALEYLWHTGHLAVCHRTGFQKAYDLVSRVIPEAHRRAQPSTAEFVDWACNGALDRLGFATSGELAAFWALVTPAEAAEWCRAQPSDRLIEVEIEPADGSKPRRAYARPDLPDELAATSAPTGQLRIMSPFDPALRDRKRTLRLFGFDYRIEVFVPEAKRRYGYYVFPILEGDRLVGRIDMRCRDGRSVMTIDGLWWEPGVRPSKTRDRKLEAELERMRRFAGAERLSWNIPPRV